MKLEGIRSTHDASFSTCYNFILLLVFPIIYGYQLDVSPIPIEYVIQFFGTDHFSSRKVRDG